MDPSSRCSNGWGDLWFRRFAIDYVGGWWVLLLPSAKGSGFYYCSYLVTKDTNLVPNRTNQKPNDGGQADRRSQSGAYHLSLSMWSVLPVIQWGQSATICIMYKLTRPTSFEKGSFSTWILTHISYWEVWNMMWLFLRPVCVKLLIFVQCDALCRDYLKELTVAKILSNTYSHVCPVFDLPFHQRSVSPMVPCSSSLASFEQDLIRITIITIALHRNRCLNKWRHEW